MDYNAMNDAIRAWAERHSTTAHIDDAVTVSTRTASETATTLTTERLCVLSAYTNAWHVLCFVERTVWGVDSSGDAVKIHKRTYTIR